MFSYVAQEIETTYRCSPCPIIKQKRAFFSTIKIEKSFQLLLYASDIVIEHFTRQQLAFAGFSAWITDHACSTTCDCDRLETAIAVLKAFQAKEWNEIPNMQTVSSRIESTIDCWWFLCLRNRRQTVHPFFYLKAWPSSKVCNQSPPLQFFVNVHTSRINSPRANANFQLTKMVTEDFSATNPDDDAGASRR